MSSLKAGDHVRRLDGASNVHIAGGVATEHGEVKITTVCGGQWYASALRRATDTDMRLRPCRRCWRESETGRERARRDAGERLKAYLGTLDEQTRRPGEPPLREAVAQQARERLAEMEQP